MTGNKERIGNFIVLDLGTHKVYGCPTNLTSRVVEQPSEKRGLGGIPQAVLQSPPDERPSDCTHAQRCSPDTSL